MSTASLAASRYAARPLVSTRLFLALALGATAILLALVSARRPAGLGRADPRRLRARRRLSQGRIQLHRIVAALSHARRGGRPARRADRDRGRARSRSCRWRRWRPRFGGAIAPLGPSLDDRRLRLRHRHAARQWLRLRHALHRRRRLRPHADRAVVLSSSAACSAACRCRRFSRSAASIRCWRPIISGPGADWRRRSPASRSLPA